MQFKPPLEKQIQAEIALDNNITENLYKIIEWAVLGFRFTRNENFQLCITKLMEYRLNHYLTLSTSYNVDNDLNSALARLKTDEVIEDYMFRKYINSRAVVLFFGSMMLASQLKIIEGSYSEKVDKIGSMESALDAYLGGSNA